MSVTREEPRRWSEVRYIPVKCPAINEASDDGIGVFTNGRNSKIGLVGGGWYTDGRICGDRSTTTGWKKKCLE